MMIKRLRTKFILLAMAALLVLLSVIVLSMNLINYHSVVNEADQVLSLLSQNQGAFPTQGNSHRDDFLPPGMSPETPYESRYFSVLIDKNGSVFVTDISQIFSVDEESAISYSKTALENKNKRGFVGDFRYVVYSAPQGSRISFLDCGRRLDAFYGFMYTSIEMSLIGLVAIFVFIFIVSGKIIKPVAESYEKQKRFITDAGHEIKTPLTIINANVDILEMELGEGNESLVDIQHQTKRLRTLTDDLVMLARMEESDGELQKIDFPVSEVVAETAHPFAALAMSQGKEFVCNIQPMQTLCGNDRSIQQLVSLLLDNALKYSPEGGSVFLSLARDGRSIRLIVFNTTASAVTTEQLKHVFDRFYRTDSSRNSETGGHGIGLSVAEAIVTAHNGRIYASTRDGHSFQITVEIPA